MQKSKHSKKIKTLDLILIVVAVLLIVFIVTMIITYWKFQSVPDTLITCVLGTGLGELIATTAITIVKKKYGEE